MTSKHSIIIGTDGPDAGVERILVPSARILESTSSSGQALTELQSAALQFKTPTNIIPSNVARPAWEPRPLDSPAPSSSSVSSAPIRSLSSQTASEMTSISSALTKILSEQKEKEDEIQIEKTMKGIQQGTTTMTTANTNASLDANATATCFDIVTNTAQRLPLARIIASSSSSNTSIAAASSNVGTAPGGETFVVLTPVDWSIHHADCTFGRLTGVNKAADDSEMIALELATERDTLSIELETAQQQLRAKDRTIELLRLELKQLRAGGGGSTSSTGSTSANEPRTSANPSASTIAPKIHDSETDGSDDDDDDEDDMADEEDGDFGQQSSGPTSSANVASTNIEPEALAKASETITNAIMEAGF